MKKIAAVIVWGAYFGLATLVAPGAENKPDAEGDSAKPAALPDARTLLTRIRDSRYDLAEAGLLRAAAYVRAPEIQSTLDPAARSILRRTQLEAIFVPHKPIEVRMRRIPPELGAEERIGVDFYRGLLETALRMVTGGLDFAYNIIDPDKLLAIFDAVVDPGDKGTVEIMLQKKTQRQDDEKNPGRQDYVRIVVGKDGLLQHIVSREKGVRTEINIRNHKHKNRWLFKSVDIAKYDVDDRFLERNAIDIEYTVVKDIVLPNKIVLSVLDKNGKLLERRNEANPRSAEFSKYEVEK